MSALKEKTIVAFGDSLTNFGGRKFSDIISKDLGIDIINAGIGGENTNHGRKRFETDVLSHKPHVVIIGFGGNDQAIRRDCLQPCVSREEYRENLTYFAQELKKIGSDVVFFTTPPMNEEKYTPWEYDLHYMYDNGRVLDSFCDIVRQVARDTESGLVDMHLLFDEYGDFSDLLLGDGMHQSDKGLQFFADRIGEYLVEKYGK